MDHENSSATQPCTRCGEETAVGSVFFSDRHEIDLKTGGRTWLCSLCYARIRSAGRKRQLTEDEVRKLVEMGSVLDISWMRL